jgi:hypothetical protein
VAKLYLSKRLDALRRTQNGDGGWAFVAGKQNSWLEPTVYAALALHGEPESDRAWALVRNWQQKDGSWKLAMNVPISNWTTSLGALLAAVKGQPNPKAQEWLRRAVRGRGWGWKDELSPAAEPTAWATLALARSGEQGSLVESARAFLWDTELRADNCGTTLAAVQGVKAVADLGSIASGWLGMSPSAAVRARLVLGLRLNGVDVAEDDAAPLTDNLAVTALEALGAREGRFSVLKTEGRA